MQRQWQPEENDKIARAAWDVHTGRRTLKQACADLAQKVGGPPAKRRINIRAGLNAIIAATGGQPGTFGKFSQDLMRAVLASMS